MLGMQNSAFVEINTNIPIFYLYPAIVVQS